MMFNRNEKCLLQFISGNQSSKDNELFEVMQKFGIKLKFKDYNPVYQIIDELSYQNLAGKTK